MADGVCLGRQIPSPHLLWTVTGGAPPDYLLTLTPPPSQALTYLPSQQTTYLPNFFLPAQSILLASYLLTQSEQKATTNSHINHLKHNPFHKTSLSLKVFNT